MGINSRLTSVRASGTRIRLRTYRSNALARVLIPRKNSTTTKTPVTLLRPRFNTTIYNYPPHPSTVYDPLTTELTTRTNLGPTALHNANPQNGVVTTSMQTTLHPTSNPTHQIRAPLTPQSAHRTAHMSGFCLCSLRTGVTCLTTVDAPVTIRYRGLVNNHCDLFSCIIHTTIGTYTDRPR